MKRKEPTFKYSNVLLVDDNELDNFINQKMLESNHFSSKIYINTSAKSALEFLNNLVVMGGPMNELHPNVIFIDINMPMIDGFQFVDHFMKNLKTKLPRIKLVILTSSVNHEDRQKALDLSKEILFLNKPLTNELLATV